MNLNLLESMIIFEILADFFIILPNVIVSKQFSLLKIMSMEYFVTLVICIF